MKLFFRKNKKQNKETRDNAKTAQSQRVFSYYTASHNQLNKYERKTETTGSSELDKRRRIKLRHHWFSIFVVAAFLICFIYLALLSNQVKVVIDGTSYRAISEYQQVANGAFQGSLLNKTKISLRAGQIESEILKAVPEASSVQVSTTLLGKRPIVTIKTDKPAAVLKQPKSQDLLVSNRGRLLLSTSQSKATTDLPAIINESGVDGKAGEQFLSPSDMSSLLSLFDQVQQDNSDPTYYLPISPREISMKEPSRGQYKVRFLLGDTILQQYGSLRAVQNKLQSLKQTPNEYIDVRLAEKVFYK